MIKNFLRKLSYFILIPFIILGIIDAFLPITFFTHRHFEAISFQSGIPSKTKFYPLISSQMFAVGDLCHHTPFEVYKYERWVTDKLGYRNEKFIRKADILFLGDSFFQGSGLSQEETISEQVNRKSTKHWSTYSMAPSDINVFLRLLEERVISKPKILVFSCVERNIPSKIENDFNKKNGNLRNVLKSVFSYHNMNVYLDKALKHYSLLWLKARLSESKGLGKQSPIRKEMFFLKGKNQKYPLENIPNTLKILKSYKKLCDSLDISFLFVPMPNKETVYFNYVPFMKQPDYLLKLNTLLLKDSIETINTLSIYNNYLKHSKRLVYHTDDTHWNKNGVALISNAIIEKISTNSKVFFHKTRKGVHL